VKHSILLLALGVSLLAQKSGSPKHLFRSAGTLTGPSTLPARAIAQDFLRSTAEDIGLAAEDIEGAYVAKEYRTAHNGATHITYKQQFQGIDVFNAAWVVNIDKDGQVLNAGGSLYPRPAPGVVLPAPSDSMAAVRSAVQAVNPVLGERYTPFATAAPDAKSVRYHRGALGAEVEGELVWHAVKGVLRPAWVFFVVDEDGISGYITIVDSASSKVLKKESRTFFQARGLVFERSSPQPNPRPGVRLPGPAPIVARTMQPLTGDPQASPRGWVTGAETAGNNVIAGVNPVGYQCVSGLNCLFRPQTAKAAPGGDFSFPVEIGPDAPNPTAFADAATVNVFYWINRAHDLFYSLGFDEAAGNFQADNFGRGGSGGDPVYAYTQYGIAGQNAPAFNNAFFSSFGMDNDGSPAIMAIYLSRTTPGEWKSFFNDAAFDAETIVHEYGHGVSHRLVRRLNASFHGGAMGEGWSDFWALELLLPEGAPLDGHYPFSEYPEQEWGTGIRTRPYSTNMEINPLTFAHLGRVVYFPEVHADGEIWAQALWEARAALIRQFGEREGRRRIRLLVIDGMKLSPPAPSMLDMRDAILLADRTNFKGESQAQLWAAFARRGMGVLAQAGDGNSIHVTPSFETPSNTGKLRFYEDRYVIGEVVRVVLHDGNAVARTITVQLTGSSGDRENLTLQRTGSVFVGSFPTRYGPVFRGDRWLEVIPGDSISVYYFDASAESGSRLVEHTVETTPDYTVRLLGPGMRIAGRETALNLRTGPFGRQLRALPFEFPFFGKKHSSVWVYNTGLLGFDLPDFAPCTDAFSLSLNNAIAPMYMDLRTDGRAQQGEDVYMSQPSPDAVTFRWAAETAPDIPTTAPEPVNFAVTLYQDGRIQLNYGAGNNNLVGGSQFFGCNTSTPTVGISNGNETFLQISELHDGKPKLENAPGLLFEPGFSPQGGPQGKLESPSPGDIQKGLISGKGIIYDVDGEMSIRRLDVVIDGVAAGRALLRESRPDACAEASMTGCPNVGFSFGLTPSLQGIAPGEHEIQLRATNSRGVIYTFPETPVKFHLESRDAPPVGRVEAPAAGAGISGTTTVRGYAYSPDLRIARVDVLVDGVLFGRAAYGEMRPDICGGLDPAPPGCPRIGFSYSLNTARTDLPLANGSHTVAIRVQDEGGRFIVLPETVTIVVDNGEALRPAGVLTSPRHNEKLSGTVRISGYAWSPDARITSVSLIIDAFNFTAIPYGSARSEECQAIGEPRGCPGIGFELDFDTRRLANGPHSIGIQVRDDKGRTEFFPGDVLLGVNVIVENAR
jgi:hypothetical protein